MKIAIVSDTHGNVANFKKAVDWINKEGISIILHCGDIGNPESLQESLADFHGKFLAVLGNMDSDYNLWIEKTTALFQSAGPSTNFRFGAVVLETEIDGRKIAVTHKPEDAKVLAESNKYDLIFYGHTHKPWEEKIRDARLVNPGELAGQKYKPTLAIYDTETNNLELKILEQL